MKKIVIMKGSFIDSLEEYVLRECLKIMFPECNIEIRAVATVNSPDRKINIDEIVKSCHSGENPDEYGIFDRSPVPP
ncbi:MAG: hypothetical protein R6V46_08530 [Desulfatiglandaceae bacterium]